MWATLNTAFTAILLLEMCRMRQVCLSVFSQLKILFMSSGQRRQQVIYQFKATS